jgi:hypothetical protein
VGVQVPPEAERAGAGDAHVEEGVGVDHVLGGRLAVVNGVLVWDG